VLCESFHASVLLEQLTESNLDPVRFGQGQCNLCEYQRVEAELDEARVGIARTNLLSGNLLESFTERRD